MSRFALPMVLSSLLAAVVGCTRSNPAYLGLPDAGAPGSYLTSDGRDPEEEPPPADAADAATEIDAVDGSAPAVEPGGIPEAGAAPQMDAGGGGALDAAAVPVGTGLRGNYFDGTMLESGTTGTLDLSRLDATIDFDWANGRADPIVDDDYFSVRWTGQVMPRHSETYTFTTVTDEGVRLWVDGVQLIDQWVDQQGVEHSGQISLQANRKYDIRMEYYERTGRASAKLYWSSATQANEIIPSSRLFEP